MSDKVIQIKIDATENLSVAATKADAALDKLEKNISSAGDLSFDRVETSLLAVDAAADRVADALVALEAQAAQTDQALAMPHGEAGLKVVDSAAEKVKKSSEELAKSSEELGKKTSKTKEKIDETRKSSEKLGEELGKSSKKAKEAGGAYDKLRGELTGMVTAFGAMQAIGMVGDTIAAGRSINILSAAFDAATGKVLSQAEALKILQQATRNAVADVDLMKNANQLLGLNIAKDVNQAGDMMSLVSRLAKLNPGQTVAEGMDSFLQVMKNGSASIELLDNIGISASRVRQILSDAGKAIGDQDAFSGAVVQAAREKLAGLGEFEDSLAAAGESAIARIQASVTNLVTDIQSRVAMSITGIAGIAVAGWDANRKAQDEAEAEAQRIESWSTAAATQLYDVTFDALREASKSSNFVLENFFGPLDTEEGARRYASALKEIAETIIKDPYLGDIRPIVVKWAIEPIVTGREIDEVLDVLEMEYTPRIIASMRDQQKALQRAAVLSLNDREFQGFNPLERVLRLDDREFASLKTDYSKQAREAIRLFEDSFYIDPDKLPNLMTFKGAEEIQQYADTIKARLEDVRANSDYTYISDVELEKMQKMADGAQELADNAKEAAERFANMKLGDFLGMGGGGVRGEIGDMVMAQLGGMGLGDGQLANIERIFNLGNGRETGLSVAVEDKVIPMLASMAAADPKLADRAILNLEQTLKKMAEVGLTFDDQMSIITNEWLGAWGGGGAGKSFTIKPGDTASSLAAQFGVSIDEILRSAGAKNARSLRPGTYNLGGGFGGYGMVDRGLDWSNLTGEADNGTLDAAIADAISGYADIKTSMTDIRSETDATVDKWSAFTANPHTLLLNIETIIPPELKKLLNMLGDAATFGTKPLRGSPTGRNVVLVD